MRKMNAFLLVEVLVALGVFAACALSIAFSSTALRIHYIRSCERRRAIVHARNTLEQSQGVNDTPPISSSAFSTFLRARGISTTEPFFYKKAEVQLKGKSAKLVLVGAR